MYRELLIDSLASQVGLPASRLATMLGRPQPGNAPSAGISRRTPAGRTAVKGDRPSVVRRAITLLLNHPQAADKLDIEKLAGVKRPGAKLLHDLIETVQSEPNLSTAGLLERWRHDDEGRHLGKLVASGVPVDDEFDAAAELADCLEQLALAGRKERIDFLIEKQRVSGLSDDEKTELRALH